MGTWRWSRKRTSAGEGGRPGVGTRDPSCPCLRELEGLLCPQPPLWGCWSPGSTPGLRTLGSPFTWLPHGTALDIWHRNWGVPVTEAEFSTKQQKKAFSPTDLRTAKSVFGHYNKILVTGHYKERNLFWLTVLETRNPKSDSCILRGRCATSSGVGKWEGQWACAEESDQEGQAWFITTCSGASNLVPHHRGHASFSVCKSALLWGLQLSEKTSWSPAWPQQPEAVCTW
jgi:hypothetical protein